MASQKEKEYAGELGELIADAVAATISYALIDSASNREKMEKSYARVGVKLVEVDE